MGIQAVRLSSGNGMSSEYCEDTCYSCGAANERLERGTFWRAGNMNSTYFGRTCHLRRLALAGRHFSNIAGRQAEVWMDPLRTSQPLLR